MTNSSHSIPKLNSNNIDFYELIESIITRSRKIGADEAFASVANNVGLSVSTRNNDIETVEQSNDFSIDITMYAGQCYGSASTSDFSQSAIDEAIQAAWHLARHTAFDSAAGLPDINLLATKFPDLHLHHVWPIDVEEAVKIAIRAEQSALKLSNDLAKITVDESMVKTSEGYFVIGNSLKFFGGYSYSCHSLSIATISSYDNEMQQSYWYTSNRNPLLLDNPENVGYISAKRSQARLKARRIHTGKFPILFEAPVALSLLGHFTQAVNGGALYRNASFLVNSIGKQIFPNHIDIIEDPYIIGGMGSTSFDNEGVQTHFRKIVNKGILEGYFLSTYTARKLGLRTTGNSGGTHNLTLESCKTQKSDNLESMIRKMKKGLLVTELIGQGVNYVTGDYSRGIFGFWVENGEIQHAVQEVTIAGNLLDIFQKIVAVGSDTICRGTKTTGSILIENMMIAGS
ncbi:MAG: metalloprotease PmbA [Bordetella sp.]|nr:MAG: metalloprotease PmbA [Bordetella sp.]